MAVIFEGILLFEINCVYTEIILNANEHKQNTEASAL